MNTVYFVGNKTLFDNDNIKYANINDVVNYCSDKNILSLDIETTCKYKKYGEIEGLDPYTSKIVMLQIGDLDKQFIIDVRYIDITSLLSILIDNNILIVGHNLKFEYKHILHNYGVRINNLYDTQLVEQVLKAGYPNIKYNLKALIGKYLNKKVDKGTRLEFLSIESKLFTSKQILYGADDIIYPLKIKALQLERINKYKLEHTVKLEMSFLPVLGEIEYNGMTFNKDKWLTTYNDNKLLYNNKKQELDNIVTNEYSNSKFINKQLDLFNPDPKVLIQWTSSKQVIEFFKYLNICPQEISKSTNKLSYTVNAKVLQSSLNTINKETSSAKKDLIKLYIQFKEFEQSVTTFGKSFLNYVNPITNRIHSNYRQIVATGRLGSSNPNVQNIPADKSFRYAFDIKSNWKIVNADYSSQETVVLANKSLESNMIDLINTGGCMHCFVTKALHPELANLTDDDIKSKHKELRQIAKAAGFAVNYGGNGFTIAANLGIPEQEGTKVYEAYFKAFPTLKKYFTKVQNEAINRGYILIDEVIGRKLFFLRPNNNKEKHAILKKALNAPIQGTSASMTKLACVYMQKWISDNNMYNKVKICNTIHDEISIECIEELSKEVAITLENCMVKAGKIWCKTVPLKADAVVVDYWSH